MLLKTTTFFFLFTFFAIGSYAQDTWTTLIGKTFHQSERFIDGTLTPDGNIIAVGIQRKPDGFNDIYMVKIELSSGDEIWSKSYGIYQNEEAYTIAATTDGFLIGGNSTSEDDIYGEAIVVKFDWDGNQQWEVIRGKTYRDQINDIVVKSDGTIYAGGYKVESSEKTEHFLLKISADGNTVEELENGIISSDDTAYDQLFLGPNEEIYFNRNSSSSPMLELNELMATTLPFNSPSDFREFRHVTFLNDRIFVLTLTGSRDIQVIEYNSTGNIIQESPIIEAEPEAGFTNQWEVIKMTADDTQIDVALVTDGGLQSLQEISFSTTDLTEQSNSSKDFPNEFVAWNILPTSTGYVILDYSQPSSQWDANAVRYGDGGIKVWDKNFGINDGPNYSGAGSIVAANNGGYLIQYVESSEDNTDLKIAQLNEDGILQWETKIPDDNPHFALSVVSQAPDGSIYTFLYTDDIPEIVKLSAEGTILWTKAMTVSNNNSFKTGLVALADGGVAASFRYFDQGAGSNTSRFVTLNGDGDFILDQQVSLDYTNLDIRAITQTSDSHIVLAGSVREFSGAPTLPYLVKMDLDGNIIWEQIVDDIVDNETFSRFYDVSETPNNKILVSGWGINESTGSTNQIIAAYRENGTADYKKILYPDSGISGGAYGNIANNQNEHYFVGFEQINSIAGGNPLTALKAWMLKTDAFGDIQWEKTWGLGTRPIIYDAVANPEGGFVGIGLLAINGSLTAFITNITGDGITETKTPILPAFEYRLTPNPTNDFINIQLKEASKDALTIEIFDMQGKMLIQDNWTAGAIQKGYAVDQFPNGIYNVVLRGATFQSTRLLIKQ